MRRGIARSRRALLAAFALVAVAPTVRSADLDRWTGKPIAPSIELLAIDGTPLTLQQLRGKVVVVNFWATWCEPCVTEIPSLQQLHANLHPQGLTVLMVNYQEGPARIDKFIKAMNMTLPVVRDTDGAVARSWGARIFPASYLVDRAGRIRYAQTGAVDWTSPSVLGIIRSLLSA